MEILGVTTPRMLPAGEGDVNGYTNIKTNSDNIQPRLGFAATMPPDGSFAAATGSPTFR